MTTERRRTKKAVSNRKRYLAKRVHIRAQQARYYRRNNERLRLRQREYRSQNAERERQRCRDWYAARSLDPQFKSRESLRATSDYKKHKAKRTAAHKLWRKRNPGYWAAIKHRRRLIENASKNLRSIKAWMKSVKSKPTAVCYYCMREIPIKQVHFDHIVPISKGGAHDVANLCVSCIDCNLNKQAKTISAWVRVGQQILAL